MNRIVLIGNGFDLAHGLKTSYKDFIDWYWDQWIIKLRNCPKIIISDELCSLKIGGMYNTYTWKNFMAEYANIPTGHSFVKFIREKAHYNLEITLTTFFESINNSVGIKGWVDIENEYYIALNKQYFRKPETLNNELQIITQKLIEYLQTIQETQINKVLINPKLKEIILSPIKINDIAISARQALIDFVKLRYFGDNDGFYYTSIGDILGFDQKEENLQELSNFSKEWSEQIENFGINSVVDNNVVPDIMLYPNRLMLLNFNYTNTADLYLPQTDSNFIINHIHGDLDNPDGIIFGYGDELDEKYLNIVKLNSNEHLRNIKSIKYLESANYRNILSFIESEPYQIFIMGHSCGNSDRTLLNTLFEHKNCVSIKPYYHQQENGSDNYLDIVQNILRNFTDMKLMRDRVVNKTFCEPLPQHSARSNNQTIA